MGGDTFSAGEANKDLAGYGVGSAYGGASGFNDYKLGNDRGSNSGGLQMARGQSVPATSYGYAKSNYTASEFDSENETHSQFQQRRKQWGGTALNIDDNNFKTGGNDLGGSTEIGVIEGSGSRRNSLKYAGGGESVTNAGNTRAGRTGSESKDRMRDQSSTSGLTGLHNPIPRPN